MKSAITIINSDFDDITGEDVGTAADRLLVTPADAQAVAKRSLIETSARELRIPTRERIVSPGEKAQGVGIPGPRGKLS